MSDDLVKRLRNTPNWKRDEYGDYKSAMVHYDRAPFEAADRIEELEAKLAKVVSFTSDVAYRATTIEHDQDEMWLLDLDVLRYERDCDITQARTTITELSKERSDEKGQDDE